MEYDFLVHSCALGRIFSGRCSDGLRLMELFGGASAVFSSSRVELESVMHNAERFIDEILDPSTLEWAAKEVSWALSYGIRLIPITDSEYPRRLKECPDAPLMLYCMGSCDLNPSRSLAVVGTRRSSLYGRNSCAGLVESVSSCSPEPLIVSGLALGIDEVAHNAALDCGLQTVAVLPTGLDRIYPASHRVLAKRIVKNGALVTDFIRGTSPLAINFIRRNRIIAGMSDGVLLAESFDPGGGLITARLAASYDRDVFAVPGRMNDLSFSGCNRLISENVAQVVSKVEEFPVLLGWGGVVPRGGNHTSLPDDRLKRRILEILSSRPSLTLDEAVSLTEKDVGEVAVALVGLEMEGWIRKTGDKYESQ